MQGWFGKMSTIGLEMHHQPFADDKVIVIEGPSVKKIEKKCGRSAEDELKSAKMKYNKEKTECMFVRIKTSVHPSPYPPLPPR